MIPPPLYKDGAYEILQRVINEDYPTIIPSIATKAKIASDHVIDLFTEFGGKDLKCPEFFSDGCHLTAEGNEKLAKKVKR